MKRVLGLLLLGLTAPCLPGVSNTWAGEPLTKAEITQLQKTRVQTNVVFENYGMPDQGSIGLIGFKFDQFITRRLYWGPAIYGAVTGDRGGFGVAAIGIGYQVEVLPNRFYWDTRLLTGSGGGSGTSTGGGFMVHGVTGFQVEFIRGIRGAFHAGYLDFPTGHFRTPVASLAFVVVGRKITLPY